MPRLIARLVLAAVLLAGWQSALVHPLSHVDKNGGFVHLGGQQQKKSDTSGLCDVLAALAACAAGQAQAPVVVSSQEEVLSYSGVIPRPAEAPPFLSQGPPAVL
jgi:hypothetical protein